MGAEAPAQRVVPIGSKEECLSVDDATSVSSSLQHNGDGCYELASGQLPLVMPRSMSELAPILGWLDSPR